MKKNNEFCEELKRLVAFPSVSSDPACRKGVLNCAAYLKRRLEKIGARTKLIATRGYPLVVARLEGNPAWPTAAIYNHYDVQPVPDLDKWKSDPFVLKVENGKYFGRGASDNKGNLLAALMAVELAIKAGIALNFEFIYEGEEESGSPNFKEGICKTVNFLKPDSIIIADAGWFSRLQPTIIYGLRGLLYMHWNLKTGERAVHSGEIGGAARNPLAELMAAAVKCHDAKTGRILIPGGYEKVKKPSKDELRQWNDVDINADKFREDHALKTLRVKDKAALLKTVWAMPTFEVHGCVGGYMKKDGRMTLVPSEGQLLVSMRLVPDQKPAEIFQLVKRYVSGLNPDIEVKSVSQAEPYTADYKSREVVAAERALREVFGLPVIKARMGGSLGAVTHLHAVFRKAGIFFMSFGLPEYRAHSPNEYFEYKQAAGGIKTLFNYFKIISKGKK